MVIDGSVQRGRIASEAWGRIRWSSMGPLSRRGTSRFRYPVANTDRAIASIGQVDMSTRSAVNTSFQEGRGRAAAIRTVYTERVG